MLLINLVKTVIRRSTVSYPFNSQHKFKYVHMVYIYMYAEAES